MRKLVAIVGATGLMLVSGAALAAGPGPKATGGVAWENAAQGLDIRAQFNAQPDSPAKGFFQIDVSGAQNWSYRGDVTCYQQDGNSATFTGVVTASEDAGNPTTFKVTVEDNGQGSNAAPDRIATLRNGGSNCGSPLPVLQNVAKGNLQVH